MPRENLRGVAVIQDRNTKMHADCDAFHIRTAQEMQENKHNVLGKSRRQSVYQNGRRFHAAITEMTDEDTGVSAKLTAYSEDPKQEAQTYKPGERVPASVTRLEGRDENGDLVVAQYSAYAVGKLPRRDSSEPLQYEYHYEIGESNVIFPAEENNPLRSDDQKKLNRILGLSQQ